MFDFFKKKTVEVVKPQIFHCVICNGNYYKEDIDFLESRKLSKIICVRCVEYIKKNSDINYKPLDLNSLKDKKCVIISSEEALKDIVPFREEGRMYMKNLETIIKNRDALKKSIDDIWEEVYFIKKGREWPDLSKEEQTIAGKLLGLKSRYFDQWIALNFVLNEDSRLMDGRADRNYEDVDERFFADVNVR